jgi:hypothetical protein
MMGNLANSGLEVFFLLHHRLGLDGMAVNPALAGQDILSSYPGFCGFLKLTSVALIGSSPPTPAASRALTNCSHLESVTLPALVRYLSICLYRTKLPA